MTTQISEPPFASLRPRAVVRSTVLIPIAALLGIALLLVGRGQATALEVLGQVGVLGEWELTARLDEHASETDNEYSGPLITRHVGICTQDGPEERAGEMRVQLGTSGSQLKAILMVEGVECRFDARKSHAYEGMMTCRDREAVPAILWLK